jgi:misacylated tRNA(Ala) deacylase
MTEALYMNDCYLKEFEAKVVAANGKGVELDKTAFYYNSGGQPNDTGKLLCKGEEYKVLFVKKDKGSIIHEVDKEGLKSGDEVKGVIDWGRRYLFMRYHTACHVLSGIVNHKTGAEITGNQIAEDKARIDFNLENFDRSQIKEFEEESNRVISEAREVALRFLPREEAMKIPAVVKLAKGLPETIKTLRVVEIAGFDQQACAGTHVGNTSEIKGIEVTGAENKGKANRRVYFRVKG